MKNTEDKMAVNYGWFRIDDTATHTGPNHYGIVPVENTIIREWTTYNKDGSPINLLKHFGVVSKTVGTADPAMMIPDDWQYGTQVISLTGGAVDILRR